MKNPPRELLAKLFNRNVPSASGTLGTRHVFPPTLLPPRIPANHTGGFNQGHIESGETSVVVPVYSGIETGQIVVLYFNDNPVDTRVVIDENQALLTYIPAHELPRGDSDNIVHYHAFTGFNGVNEEASYPVSVRVKTTVPGNPPGDPSEPGVNPYLLAPVDVPPSIPDPAAVTTVPVGVPVYANMAEGDVITVFWGGAGVVAPPLTAAQVGRVVYVEVPQAIVAARPGNNIVVRYHVYDAVRNYSLYSQSAFSNVTPVATLLAPLIAREVNDTLNMDSLAGSDIDIMVMQNNISPTADITLHFTGQPEDWPYLDFSLGPIRFGGAGFHTFTVPNVLGRSLVNSETIVFYEAVTNGTTARSLNAQAQVIGTAIDLPAPVAPDAQGGVLDPDKITGATFDLTAPANTAFVHDTLVQLVWEGFNGAGDAFHHELTQTVTPTTAGAAVTFKVQKSWAEEIAGGSVELHYNLIVPGNLPVTYVSNMLPLNVAGETTLLPVPGFEPELTADDQLDVDKLTGAFNVKVNIVDTVFVGGTLKVYWQGQSAARILEAPVSSTGVIRVSVDRATLIDPNLDQSVDVWYEIVRPDGRVGRSGHVLVTVINGASVAWPMPEVWDFTDKPVNPWNPVRPGTTQANVARFVVRDARLQVNDAVAPLWRLPDGTTLSMDLIPVTTAGVAQGEIPSSILAESLGKTVEVLYLPILAGTPGTLSDILMQQLQALPSSALSELIILQAANGGAGPEFDVGSLTTDATLRVSGWPFITQGQSAWLTLSGINQDGSAYSKQLIGPPSVVDQGWANTGSKTFTLPVGELKGLKDASSLTLTLKVDTGGGTSEAAAVVFTPKIYTVKSTGIILAPPEVLEAPNWTLDFATVHTARHITVRARISAGTFDIDPQATYTVRVRWSHDGYVYQSDIVETTLPRTLDFQIPRLEVIDVIRAQADIDYTVYGNGQRLSSVVRTLHVTGQDIELPAPRFDSTRREVTVLYPAQLTGHRVTVRWTGVTTHETAEASMQTGVIKPFSIPAQWLTENTGKMVLVNYSVLRRTGELKLFSRLLRLQL